MDNGPIKILHIGKFYPPHRGGIESHVQVLCRELAKHAEVEVIVANENPKDEESWDGRVRIRRAGVRFKISSAPICPSMPGLIRRAKANLVHIHLPNPPAILALFASGYRGPVIATYHSDIVRQEMMARMFNPILRFFLKRCAVIIATSQRYIETSPVLPDHVERCRVIPFGVSPAQFSNADATEVARLRERYGSRIVMGIGRLIYYKGFEYLVEAMSHIDGHLLIVGEGPLRPALENKSKVLGLERKITFLGDTPDVVPYYQAADVFAFPSIARSEAFGIVQLEAMACGKPVVNTNLDSGVPFVSLDGVTGLTVPPRDPIALAGAINKLLDNAELRAQYGQAAQARVEKEFREELMVERILQTYRKVLSLPEDEKKLSLTAPAAGATKPAPEPDPLASI